MTGGFRSIFEWDRINRWFPRLVERMFSSPPWLAGRAVAAWERAGRPGVLVLLTDDPDPVAVRLDLRPWGFDRLKLTEPGAVGLRPRPDLFPSANPLA